MVLLEQAGEVGEGGHRGVVAEGYQAIEQKLNYLVTFSQQVNDLRDKGLSIREITRRLLGREDFTSLATMGHFTKGNLVRGCLGERGRE